MVMCPHCHTLITHQHTGAQPAGSSQDRQIPLAPSDPIQPGMNIPLGSQPIKKSRKSIGLIAALVLGLIVIAILVAAMESGARESVPDGAAAETAAQ